MLHWWRDRQERKALLRAEAADLVKFMGQDGAWQHLRSIGVDLEVPEEERRAAWALFDEVERQCGIKRQTDTATRYLFPDKD